MATLNQPLRPIQGLQQSWRNLISPSTGDLDSPFNLNVQQLLDEEASGNMSPGYHAYAGYASNYASPFTSLGKRSSFSNWLNRNLPSYLNQYNFLRLNEESPFYQMSWLDFLGTINPYKDYQYSSPQERGEGSGGSSSYAPSARWIIS